MRRARYGQAPMSARALLEVTIQGREKALVALTEKKGPGAKDRAEKAKGIRAELEELRRKMLEYPIETPQAEEGK